MKREEKARTIFILVLFVFLIGYLFGISMCRKMPERFGIVPNETESSCCENDV